jgi:cytochrome P450 family 142 subfamily A polypeptide 1
MVDVDVSYVDSANWDETEMRERFRWLRENDPVYWSEKDQLWIITKHDDVEHISKHQKIFTSAEGVRPMPVKIGLIDEGEPRHGQLRGLINKGFTPRMVKKLEVTFRELTQRAIDAVANDGQCDFVQSISVPLPLWLIASMIGIREEDWDRFHGWSDDMIAAEGNLGNAEVAAKAGKAYAEYAAYATEVIEDRRRNPQDDLISILTGAKDKGMLKTFEVERRDAAALEAVGAPPLEGVHNDELIKLCVILLVAGNETTRNGISGGMQLLIENPEERRKLIENPALLNSAVEEMVRLTSPVHSFCRTVVEDTELRGKRLEKGQRVLMIYGSANRDAEFYGPDADAFKIDRGASHLGFGIGTHFCMGANLARMEMRVVFSEVLRRLPDMEYAAGGPVFRNSALVRTVSEMRVRYTPEGDLANAA